MAMINTGFVLNPKVSAFNQVRPIFNLVTFRKEN